ncbi:hypothetical protein ACYZT7_10160 [Pseudomonas sp. RT4P38]
MYWLFLLLLTSASIAAIVEPTVKPEAGNAPLVVEVSPLALTGKVDLK